MSFGSLYRLSPFDPTIIAGCQAWWHADALSLTDGTAVTSLADGSGNGWTATPQGSQTGPTFKTGIINGLPVLRYTTSSQGLTTAASLTLQAYPSTYVAVVKPTTGFANNYIMATASGSLNNSVFLQSGTGAADFRYAYVKDAASANYVDNAATYGSLSSTAWTIVMVTIDATGGVLYFGNVSQGTTTWVGTAGANTNANGMGLGNRPALTGTAFQGDIPEWIVYNQSLNSTDRGTVYNGLKSKYGL